MTADEVIRSMMDGADPPSRIPQDEVSDTKFLPWFWRAFSGTIYK